MSCAGAAELFSAYLITRGYDCQSSNSLIIKIIGNRPLFPQVSAPYKHQLHIFVVTKRPLVSTEKTRYESNGRPRVLLFFVSPPSVTTPRRDPKPTAALRLFLPLSASTHQAPRPRLVVSYYPGADSPSCRERHPSPSSFK